MSGHANRDAEGQADQGQKKTDDSGELESSAQGHLSLSASYFPDAQPSDARPPERREAGGGADEPHAGQSARPG